MSDDSLLDLEFQIAGGDFAISDKAEPGQTRLLVGPADILGAKERSFCLDGDLGGGNSWQRFIACLVTHGPVNTYHPGSILQQVKGTYTILGNLAADVNLHALSRCNDGRTDSQGLSGHRRRTEAQDGVRACADT